jgi:hypothetical protein
MLQNIHNKLGPAKVDLNVLLALVTLRKSVSAASHEMLSTTSFTPAMSLTAEI